MPVFIWEGTTKTGEKRSGTTEGINEEFVIALLKKQEIRVTSIRKKAGFKLDLSVLSLGSGVTSRDLVIFTRQFATMINAGLPLVTCLDILGNQADNPVLKKILLQVKSDVEGGSTFADALRKHPKVFDDLFVNLVAAGEIGGILDTIMNRLAAYIEKNEKIIKKVKGAMTYPIAVLVVAIALVIGMLWKVIPMFAKMFADFGGDLPGPTKFVMDLSDAFLNHLFLIMGSLIGFVVFIILFVRSRTGKEIMDRVLIQTPVFGDVIRKSAVAKFTRTMSTMISSGVPILDALNIVARAAGNVVVEKAIMYTREKISEGKNIAEPMMETKVFPPMVVQMIAVGEATGAMDTMMSKIADFYEDEVDHAVETMTSLLEPIIMVFLAVIAGGLVISMYLPIFSVAGAIK